MITVDHWGTFEVANFGDLLYPLILDRELRRLLPGRSDLEVRLTGPIGGWTPMGLERAVRRATRHDEPGFWAQAESVDAFVLGGGDLVHGGTTVVDIEGGLNRIDNWSFAVELGFLADVRPVAWNGVGVPFDVPPELAPVLRAACARVDLLAVRDEGSRLRLEAAGLEREVAIVPDTAVLLDEVVPEADRRAALDALRAARLLPAGPVLVAHVSFVSPGVLAEVASALRAALAHHPDLQPVLLALGPTHGDGEVLRELAERLDGPTWLLPDPTVVEVVAVLGAAELAVSSSYHATLVATTLGVPALTFFHYHHQPAKSHDLAALLGRERWLLDRPSDIVGAVDAVRAGDGRPDHSRVAALQRAARAHFERVAEVVTAPARPAADLAERDSAHAHLVESLQAARRQEARQRAELTLLQDHHDRTVARARDREALYWRVSDRAARGSDHSILDLDALGSATLDERPYRWGHVGPLFSPTDAARLSATVPLIGAEERADSDGRRAWSYFVRPLVAMGGSNGVRPHELDPAWRALADDLGGPRYRAVVSRLTGVDLSELDLEANVFFYPQGGYQEPHPDLPEKVVTHVLWFNEGWEAHFGGCLRILNSHDPDDLHCELLPSLGWSAVFVRSEYSWHSVTAVADDAPLGRRAVVATFYRPGSTSTMWPHGV